MATVDLGQIVSVGHDEIVGTGDHHATEQSEGLCVSDDALALNGIVEQLREPRDCGDELHAHADERAAAPEEQPVDRRRESGRERGERVDQDAPHEHARVAEEVGEVPADESEDAARDGGHVCSVPTHELTARLLGSAPSRSARAGRTMSGSINSS